jgi:hypothetical protein
VQLGAFGHANHRAGIRWCFAFLAEDAHEEAGAVFVFGMPDASGQLQLQLEHAVLERARWCAVVIGDDARRRARGLRVRRKDERWNQESRRPEREAKRDEAHAGESRTSRQAIDVAR